MSDPPSLATRFREFYQFNYPKLHLYAASQASAHHPADDLLQDAIERAWALLCRDNERHGHDWYLWVRSIIKWIAMDEWGRHKKAPTVLAGDIVTDKEIDLIANAPDDSMSPADMAIQRERAGQIKKALDFMDNEQEKRLLELLYFDSASHPTLLKVAGTLGINPASISKMHERAKASFKAKLRIVAPDINTSTDTLDYES